MPDKERPKSADILFSGLSQALPMFFAEPICYCLGREPWRVWVIISKPRTEDFCFSANSVFGYSSIAPSAILGFH
jgi:hypothetical protein